jgi:hypothetical protein
LNNETCLRPSDGTRSTGSYVYRQKGWILLVTGRLGGVVVSVLATGTKSRGFKPDRGDGFLRAIKIHSTPSFGWEVKPEIPCRNILWHVKDLLRSFAHSSYLPQMSLLVGLPESSGGRVRSYPQTVSSPPRLSMLTYHPGDEQ